MRKIEKFLWKLSGKKMRLMRRLGVWLLAKQARPAMDKYGWKTLRWLESTSGLYVVYYVCREFPHTKPDKYPLGDNGFKIKTSREQKFYQDAQQEPLYKHHDHDFQQTHENQNHSC